jgi:uncharacterized protein (TIGR02145 family)
LCGGAEYDPTTHKCENNEVKIIDSGGGDNGGGNPDIVYGKLPDSRDGKEYRTVKIGTLTWMAENLNYETDESWCYDNESSNCVTYGRLYSFDAALEACPAGWRLSTQADWTRLDRDIGPLFVGTKLKSKTGWDKCEDILGDPCTPDGTDEYGFTALPGGRGFGVTSPNFTDIGKNGQWWAPSVSGGAYIFIMRNSNASVTGTNPQPTMPSTAPPNEVLSIRCVMN